MKKRHKAEEIIRILREVEAGASVTATCRKHNISEQSFYRWRKKYGSLPLDEARRMKTLESENARLKKLVADQALTIQGLKELNAKKW